MVELWTHLWTHLLTESNSMRQLLIDFFAFNFTILIVVLNEISSHCINLGTAMSRQFF